jgi:hypothetical protein
MAELNIRERQAGDVTVLDMTAESRSAKVVCFAQRSVALEEGKKNILNLAGVAISIRAASVSWSPAHRDQ